MSCEQVLKIVFAGTPAFASTHLHALLQSRHKVVAVYTQPDRPAGRGKQLKASPVKQLALDHQLPVFQPDSLKAPQQQAVLATHDADLMVVVAYGLLLPQTILDTPRLGCINVHGSILPRWRGAAPIQRAIEAGDSESGVTIMQMEAGLDTGPMHLISRCAISRQETAASLHDKLAELGQSALIEVIDKLEKSKPQVQNDALANYASKIEKHEALINWQQPAEIIERRIRAFNPFPICFSFLKQMRIRVLQASVVEHHHEQTPGTIVTNSSNGIAVACGKDLLCIEQLQLPGKKPVSANDLLNGNPKAFVMGHAFTDNPTNE